MKFYRLKHANAVEVLSTIQAIEQNQQESRQGQPRGVSLVGGGRLGASKTTKPSSSPNGVDAPNANQPSPAATSAVAPPINQVPIALASATTPSSNETAGIVPGSARVTVDQPTNTIIVIGDRATQQVYEELCEYLDRRPLQVMIEARIVIVNTSNNYSLGVDLSAVRSKHLGNLLAFTQFGLATVDTVSGSTTIVPGGGLNTALVSPEQGDAILRALSGHKKAKVTSAPRVLVNDNATGTLASVQEVPFTSVNASTTVATTSFAGLQKQVPRSKSRRGSVTMTTFSSTT